MMRLASVIAAAALAGCAASAPPEVLRQWQAAPRYTCCNIHYENPGNLTDANYFVGSTLPVGSPATVEAIRDRALTFRAGPGTEFTITQVYGVDQEPAERFFAKLLVETDPRPRLAAYPPAVRDAINDGRVEVGMTREQVLLSLGYPPTHRTASPDLTTWTYWYNRWLTYQVQFNGAGQVSGVVGSRAPTRGEPVAVIPPPPVAPDAPPRRY